MSSKSAKCARMSEVARNVKNGVYLSMQRFANYGSVVEDSIVAQQREADLKLQKILSNKKAKGVA
jgi:hypothetical protein